MMANNINLEQFFDAVDESARRQHAHIQAVAADALKNVDRAIQQKAAIGALNGAELAQLKHLAGPSLSVTQTEVTQHGSNSEAPPAQSPERDPGATDPGATPSVPEGERKETPSTGGHVRWPQLLGAATIGGLLSAIAAGLIWSQLREPSPPPAQSDAGSMYQYLEDRDAHLP